MTTPATDPLAVVTTAKRPYVAPALVEHGNVRTLTQAPKTGEASDNDGGSFTAGLVDDEPASG